jgi:hypothetical protein
VLNKRFGIIIFQSRFNTANVNWIKTNHTRRFWLYFAVLKNPRFLEVRYHIKDVACHLLVAEKAERNRSLHFAVVRYGTIMQTEIVLASHTQFKSLLVAILFMENFIILNIWLTITVS